MSGYQATCPSCGADLVFSLGNTLLKVCEHCGSAIARKGAKLENYGRVAELLPTPSVLKLGITGGYAGAPPFSLVGRLQLDYGAGTWDEWLLSFGRDSWAWLSESQGRFAYMGVAALPPVPAFGDLRVGETLDLGASGTFVVAEVREARFMTAAGELPFDVKPGSLLRYADLSGPRGQFATLDYGTGTVAEALYVGPEVSLEELGIHKIADDEERRKTAHGDSLACPKCGGPLKIRAPDQTQRVACPWCGSLLDATKDLAVLEALSNVTVQPLIPLGSKGTLGGTKWTLIGFMERSAKVEGIRYPWHEYLLYEPHKGFRWLVEARGHWSFVEPAHTGDVHQRLDRATYRGSSFRHFQGSMATVDEVLGEFYWAVARGDSVESQDFTAPPHLLSMEGAEAELVWSYGTYLEPSEVWTAFLLQDKPPEREGVGMNQPSPYQAASRVANGWALLGTALLCVVYGYFLFSGGRSLHKQSVSIPASAASGSAEAAIFTDAFFVQEPGNLELEVSSPLNNSWLYLSGALINEETGSMDEFDTELEYYSGSDSDGAWSEGSDRAVAYVSDVEPGRYVLRLEPQWETGKTPPSYSLLVRSRVPRFWHVIVALVALWLWPLILGWKRARFETQRWSESDHAWIGSGD
jgi:DNA-directed RNA polymerase subunit RPC12/RpoP